VPAVHKQKLSFMIRITKRIFLSLFFCFSSAGLLAQAVKIKGVVRDARTNETVVGATVSVKGTSNGTATDIDGKFELLVDSLPQTLVISFIGYNPTELVFTDASQSVQVKLKSSEIQLKAAEVTGSRISEKQKEAPLTVESMDILAIKECAQTSFYEALGTMKGVDLTSASLGFTIINTRGFNSTSPVRSLQLIDGVDNQSPGLNFSLGNFLGAPELDVMKVDIISGASSAYYGPNAFNGVISMTTRSPFVKPGLEVSAKVGERSLAETSVRWAQAFKNKAGEDKFAYKVNLFYMKADDWEADNMDPTPQSRVGIDNPGGYDAVNRYGDEYISNADFSTSAPFFPGLGIFSRTGYHEKELVDYDAENLKLGTALHYKLKSNVEVILASNFGTGTTIYQGDNRYSLKNILFYQNRLELRKQDKFFLRAYTTHEDAGDTYDAFFTALKLQSDVLTKSDSKWAQDYYNFWSSHYSNSIKQLPGYPKRPDYPSAAAWAAAINPFLFANYHGLMQQYHDTARAYADNHIAALGQHARFEPGTARFDSALHAVTTTLFTDGGSKFYDKSALYHFQGEYKFTPKFADIITGGSYRQYHPDSKGNIFSDTGNTTITNSEFGIYGGIEKRLWNDKLKLNVTARLDKNENFDYLFSPAVSAVYTINPTQILRLSFSSAIRNPTLTDQYLYYRVSPLVLLTGNLQGFDSLVTVESLLDAMNNQDVNKLSFFNVAPIQPEEVKTIEIGYRSTLFQNLYLDMVGYYSWYNHFIGYKIGATYNYEQATSLITPHMIYRVATNSVDEVTTRGAAIGLSYFFKKFFTLSGNYSYNILDRQGSTDPLIPAFNTPENKFNIGLTGRDIDTWLFKSVHLKNIGFGINFKWIQGFMYEGSPQFTGYVPSYNVLDAQVSYHIPKIYSTVKVGASNVLDYKKFTVYGGPVVGRLAYISILVELTK